MHNRKTGFNLIFLLLLGIASLALYFFIIFNRFPSFLRPISIATRFGFTIVAPIIFIMLSVAFKPQKWTGVATTMIAVFLLFGFALSGLWASGRSEPALVNGLLPVFDPRHYYLDALGWLQGYKLSEQSSMRPIFTSFLSLLLSYTGKNLQVSTGLLTCFLAIFVIVFAIKIREVFGFFVSAFSVFIIFLFSRRFLGITFSENLGLIFSLLGFTALWIGSKQIKPHLLLTGLFLVSLALNIRPGPFFILIGLLTWSWLIQRDTADSVQKIPSKLFWGSALIAVISPFILNVLVQKLTSSTGLVPFANFAYAFYGLVNGGQSFSQALVDFPKLSNMPGNDHYFTVFHAALDIFIRNPMGFIQGCIHNLRYFLLPDTWYSVFGYVDNDSMLISIVSRSLLEILSVFAFLPVKKTWQDPNRKLIGMVMVTTLISVPFVPPTDAHKLRLYATVIPIIAVMPGLGLLSLLEIILPNRFQRILVGLRNTGDIRLRSSFITAISIVLTVIVLLSPILARVSSRPSYFEPVECLAPQQEIYFEYSPGSSLNVFHENESFLDWLPNLHIGTFKLNLHGLPPDTASMFADIKPSSTLINTIDLRNGEYLWIVIKTDLLPQKTGVLIAACGTQQESMFEINKIIYYVEEY